jgi:hypothetical protein
MSTGERTIAEKQHLQQQQQDLLSNLGMCTGKRTNAEMQLAAPPAAAAAAAAGKHVQLICCNSSLHLN